MDNPLLCKYTPILTRSLSFPVRTARRGEQQRLGLERGRELELQPEREHERERERAARRRRAAPGRRRAHLPHAHVGGRAAEHARANPSRPEPTRADTSRPEPTGAHSDTGLGTRADARRQSGMPKAHDVCGVGLPSSFVQRSNVSDIVEDGFVNVSGTCRAVRSRGSSCSRPPCDRTNIFRANETENIFT